MRDEIIIYQSDESSTRIEVRIEEETIWLSQTQIVELFDSSKANISEHIKHILESQELEEESTVRKIRTVQIEGNRSVNRNITHYNLDMIISIGYRVNSKRGTQFRIWANKVLKEYLLRGYAVNSRIDRVETNIDRLQDRMDTFELELRTSLPPKEGIFFEGQIFDSYVFVSDLIKSAKSSIILIDTYIDESVLYLLSKRHENVKATIYSTNLTKKILADIKKYNDQYSPIEIETYTKSHDRFLILDRSIIYHIGASLKDLGKKWFAFSKIELDVDVIIKKLKEK